MIKRNELKLEYQQHQFYEYFNSIFDYDILDTSISENIYLLREKTHKLFYSEFENQLFETIMFLSMKTLVLDINHFSKEIENKSKAYEQYIQQIREENGISNFFDRYPYLLKQINREVGLVVESYSLLFDRFLKDLSEIRSCFNITESLSNVEFSLGDSHSQKQTVVKIEFKGKSVYYKPKSYDSYNILLELISLLKSNNIPSFSLPESLIKADYCWQLGVAYTSSNKDEVAKIYFKYGVLAAFSEIFSITDLHMENVIVSGGDLYLIDVETFFQRKLNVQNQNFEGITVDTYQRIYKTSLSNGLFPVQFEKNSAPNVSGISGKGGKRKKGKYELINKNRGDMKLVKTDYFQEDGYNILTLNGKVVEPLDYANEVIAGFRECYTFLMSQRAKVKKILEDFPKLKTRAIFRNTSDYGKFLQASTNPKYLFSEKKRENLFSILHESKHIEQFIVVSEIKDLMNGEMIFVNRKDTFLTILYTLIFQIITVSIPFFIRGIIDGNWVFLKKFGYLESAVLLSIIIFFQGGFYFLKNISLVKLQNKFHSTISEKFVTKLLKLPIEYIGKIDKTDIIHRYNGLMIVRELLSERIISIWLDIILMFASISYITYVSTPLGVILGIVFIVEMMIFFLSLSIKQEKLGKEVLRQKNSLQTFFSLMDGLFLFKAKNSEKELLSKWDKSFKDYINSTYDRNRYFNLLGAVNYVITFSIPILLILLFLYYSPNSSSGELILLYMMVLNFINPINNILNSIDEILYGVKHYERVLEISTLDDEANGTYKLSEDTDIEINLENINYHYELNGAEVLNGINLKVHSGEFVAIIGKSGSGKTTLAKMLLGYVSPSSGDITYNNISYSKIDKTDFRNISAFVSQDSPIFDGDVMYNISLGRESVSGEQVIETCKRVSLYEDIRSMPMKFHTPLFRDNPSLSGGQKQRISLARELVTTPRILVLDEPTSALDVKTERIIQKNVEALHCTRVLVTHRLNTVEKADKILIMDNGKIIDYGNHHYLYKNNKDYCDLYDSYMNKYQEEEAK